MLRVAAATAATAAVATAIALLLRRRRSTLSREAQAENIAEILPFVRLAAADDAAERAEVLAEQLSRNAHFVGPEGHAKLRNAFVVVVGIGAVGSHAAALLARAGVGRLRLVDDGAVSERALRGQALARRADLGAPKAAALRAALLRVVPDAEIEVAAERFCEASSAALLGGSPDYVLLAVRCVRTLALGLARCAERELRALPVLSAAAAAGVGDVSEQVLAPLHEVSGVADARRLARLLRREMPGAPAPFAGAAQLVVHSAAGRPRSDAADAPVPPLSARGALLAGLGHAAAAVAHAELAGLGAAPAAHPLMSRGQRDDLWKGLQRREREGFGGRADAAPPAATNDLWPEDVEYLVNDVWGRRCALSGAGLGGPQAMVLTRWDRRRPAAVDNLVLLAKARAEEHDAAPHAALFGEARARAVDAALRTARRECAAWRGEK